MLELHVQPGARRSEVAGLHGERLKIRLAARAVEGAANEALREFLADALHAAKRDVTIERGAASRQKTVSVAGAVRTPEALIAPQTSAAGSGLPPRR